MQSLISIAADLSWPFAITLAWVVGEFGHRWTGLPRISFYGVIGFVLAQTQVGVLPQTDAGPMLVLADVAFGLILFEVGYRINLRWLKNNPWIAVTGLVESLLTFAVVYFIGIEFGSTSMTALLLASLCTLVSTRMQSWHGILLLRMLMGLALSGVAAVAMSYLAEEIQPTQIAFAMGLYISGNSIGGMSGRLLTGVLTDFFGWRLALTAIGCCALAAALMFWKILPPSRHFRPLSLRPRSVMISLHLHWRDAALPWLFAEGFLLMGAFVTLFNYIGYRLLADPYDLSQAVVGLLSVVYLSGIYSSAKIGSLADRLGRRRVLWATIVLMLAGLALTMFTALPLVIFGMLVFTFGFFAAHSVASSWIGRRATKAKGQASSLYLFSYYAGSSIAGTAGGVFWHLGGWNGIGLFIGGLLLVALLVALKLAKLPPLPGTGATI